MSSQPKHFFEFGPFRLDVQERLLMRHNDAIHLPPKAFETLLVLVENRGHLLAKQELMNKIWAETFVEEGNLALHISTLRRVLDDLQEHPQYIETVPRYGYRFVAPVKEYGRETVEAGPNQELATPPPRVMKESPAQVAGGEAISGSRSRPPLGRVMVPALSLVLLAVAIVWVVRFNVGKGKTKNVAPIRSLAVLPLANLSGDPSQEYLADGLTEELITDLAQIKSLQVISRTSVMQYRSVKKSLPEIARELQVDAVVEGAVLRSGQRVRITAQLIEARTDRHLWAQTYERDLRDMIALQGEVAREIARQVGSQLTPMEQARLSVPRPVDPKAYEDYLQGRYFWNKREQEGYKVAIAHFEQAIHADPNYAPAYAGLADAYALLGSWPNATMQRKEAMPKAKALALKAVELDDTLAEAHTSLAFVEMHYEWNFSAAEKEFQRAIELNPSYATAHEWYAFDLVAMHRPDDALAEIRRAQQVDPLSLIINTDLGEMLNYAGQPDAAVEQCEKVLAMNPSFFHAHGILASIYLGKKMYPKAVAESRKAAQGSANTWFVGELASALSLSGRRTEARQLLHDLTRLSQEHYDVADDIASVHAGLGDKKQAFWWLEKAYQERSGSMILLNVAPVFDPLRSDPRFVDLVRRVGLPQ
jgi:TolB-like protein/DNA-binding winged helix-turn-helix (wHTH) protein/Tfp pilus assembly protein PilF